MQKRHLFAIGTLVLCTAVAVGYYQFNKPHEGTSNIAPGVTVGALSLYAAYEADEKGSDSRFLGQVLLVKGRVTEITRTATGGNIVLGKAGGGGINCSFGPGNHELLKNIHTGDSVSCKGRCTGFLMDVNLSDCVLEP